MIRRSLALVLGAFLAIGACSSEESSAPHSHTPETIKLYDGATELTAPHQFTTSQTLRVEIKLYNDHGEEIVLDDHHVVGIVPAPAGLLTVAAVAGEPTMFDLTAQATAGSGSVTVGWGHDSPDELTFGPFAVDVVP